MPSFKPVGIFDSGYGGLTVYKEVARALPDYDFVYLGDNARSPYGPRSFEVVYEYTLEAVKKLFEKGCDLIVVACNTASAKALRNIQQKYLPAIDNNKRVLGVIRPSVEALSELTVSNHVGILGTSGTVRSNSYPLEIEKISEGKISIVQEACPMWVPLVENNEYDSPGGEYFIEKHINNLLSKDPEIDTIVLGCTHYPILIEKIRKFVPEGITIISQGEIVAKSTVDYLKRHSNHIECSRTNTSLFFTTESKETFRERGMIFLDREINVEHIVL